MTGPAKSKERKPMPTNWEGIRCKSYSLAGIDGGELVISETIDRLAIEVTVQHPGMPNMKDSLMVRLTAKQFEALCNMNSHYDGLEVKGPQAEEPAAAVGAPQ